MNKKQIKEKRPKAREIILKQNIDVERREVIRLDLELSFLNEMKDKSTNVIFGPSAEEVQEHYNYHLNRLNFFKSIRDKIRDANNIPNEKEIKEILEEKFPETLEVTKK